MEIEVIYTAVKDNQSVSIRAREQMETCNRGKIQAMKEVVAAFVPPEQQKQIEVKCSPNALSVSPMQTANPNSNEPQPAKMISGKQISLLMRRLRENGSSVQDLCLANGVNCIQDLTMAKAREIIHDLS